MLNNENVPGVIQWDTTPKEKLDHFVRSAVNSKKLALVLMLASAPFLQSHDTLISLSSSVIFILGGPIKMMVSTRN